MFQKEISAPFLSLAPAPGSQSPPHLYRAAWGTNYTYEVVKTDLWNVFKCFIRTGANYIDIGTKEDQGSVRPFPLELWLAPPRPQQETDVACYEKGSGQPFSYYSFSSFSLSIVSVREVTLNTAIAKGWNPSQTMLDPPGRHPWRSIRVSEKNSSNEQC